jgi:hypothetical protein
MELVEHNTKEVKEMIKNVWFKYMRWT